MWRHEEKESQGAAEAGSLRLGALAEPPEPEDRGSLPINAADEPDAVRFNLQVGGGTWIGKHS